MIFNLFLNIVFQLYNIIGHYVISMCVACAVSLSFEAPFLAMEKIIFGGGGGRRSDDESRRSSSNQSTPPLKKVSDLPSYDSEMRSRTFTTAGSKEKLTDGRPGHNGLFRNGGDGLYRPSTENGRYKGIDNGAFCRL